MFKAIARTLIILVIVIAIGWGSYVLIQNMPQGSLRGSFRDGNRPNFADNDDFRPNGNFVPGGFRDEDREFRGPGGFGVIAGFGGILGHLFLFAGLTVLVVLIGRLLPKKPLAKITSLPDES